MKKYIYYVLEALLAIVIVFGLIRYFYGQDDAWMCINGTWEKYGNPRSAQPDFECPKIGEQVVTPPVIKVTNFSECEAAGFPVMEIYPRQCQGKDMIYVEEVAITDEAETAKYDLIRLESVHAGDSITSPVKITGEARGNWFFEASFPISIVNWDGLIIGQGIATAQSEWMTEEFVPFEANITFDKATYKNNGAIILQKDNPSGLPENDDALEIQIFFK